jgi:prepilin-type N-terminal cleavage/methylation domain-containing protein
MEAARPPQENPRVRERLANKGFTLIELLIVVAIIAILAAIAVPNFLEAQTRAKVSRAKADMRSLATGLESYRVDYNAYPLCNNFGLSIYDPGASPADATKGVVLERLSTPIAYMTSGHLPDPFSAKGRTGTIDPTTGNYSPTPDPGNERIRLLKYFTPIPTGLADVQSIGTGSPEKASHYFIVLSNGPDQIYPNMSGLLRSNTTEPAIAAHTYDPTNGTVSFGDISRIGGVPTGEGNYGGPYFATHSRLQR